MNAAIGCPQVLQQQTDLRVAQLKHAAKVERLSLILEADLDRANGWIDKKIAAKETA